MTIVVRLGVSDEQIAALFATFPKLLLKSSPGKGLGVFADSDIPAGEYVTAYPAHSIWRVLRTCDDSRQELERISGNSTPDDAKTYGLCVGEYCCVGDPQRVSPKVLGHMINDAARSHRPQDEELYSMISETRENVRPEVFAGKDVKPRTVIMKTTQDIKSGEELFFSYGTPYWRFKW